MTSDVEKEGKDEVDEYEQKLRFVNSIANPIASKKLTKKLFKCIKKGKYLQIYSYYINFVILNYI